jgi:site-specific DNA recombinase
MFTRYAERKDSIGTLAVWARRKRLTRPDSRHLLTKSQVHRILTNEIYLGQFRWAGKLYAGKHQPIVSRALFDAAQNATTATNKAKWGTRKFTYGNLMTCAVCGCAISAQIKKEKYTYYHCTGMRGNEHKVYVPEPSLTQQFSQYMTAVSVNPDQASEAHRVLLEAQTGQERLQETEQTRVRSRLDEIDAWQEQAYTDRLSGKITERQWQSLNDKWLQESKELKSQLRATTRRHETWYPVSQKILELLQYLPALWDMVVGEEKRKLVDLIYSNCALDGRTLCVTYRKPFRYFAEGSDSGNKLGDRDSNPDPTVQSRVPYHWTISQFVTLNRQFQF